jgi:hypothetical protein
MRLNWVELREGYLPVNQFCYVAGCLDIGRPSMQSIF